MEAQIQVLRRLLADYLEAHRTYDAIAPHASLRGGLAMLSKFTALVKSILRRVKHHGEHHTWSGRAFTSRSTRTCQPARSPTN